MSLPTSLMVVVQAEGPDDLRHARATVGAMRYQWDDRSSIAFIVKVTLTLRHEDGSACVPAAWCPEQLPLSGDVPCRYGAPASGLDYATDFVPEKAWTDIHVVGQARAAREMERCEGRLHGSGVGVPFSLVAGRATDHFPMCPPFLSAPEIDDYLGPRRIAPPAQAGVFVGRQAVDFNAAPPPLRVPLGRLEAGGELGLEGAFGETRIVLPDIVPVVTHDGRLGTDVALSLALDTIWIDLDEDKVALVWRGAVDVITGEEEIDRLVVSLEHRDRRRSKERRLADLQRGDVSFALTEDAVLSGDAPVGEDARLELARYATWAGPTPEPRIPLPTFASIEAQLAEWPDRRGGTLEAHGWDEDRFAVEERCWLEAFAADAVTGAAQLATSFGELYAAAQAELETPEERRRTLREYAELRFRLERSDHPTGVLEEAKVSLPVWLRLDRRWAAAAENDPEVRAELARILDELALAPDTEGRSTEA